MTNEQVMALFQSFLAALQSNSAPTAQAAPAPQIGVVPNIEPFVPAGAPSTTYLDITKHVLSNPQAIEGIASYAYRVSDQAHAGEGVAGGQIAARNSIGLGYGIGVPLKDPRTGFIANGPVAADGSNWPLAVDFYFNRRAYLAAMAPDQLAKELADAKIQQDALDKLKGQNPA